GRHAGVPGRDGCDATVVEVRHVVQRRHIHTGDTCKFSEHRGATAGSTATFPHADDLGDLRDGLLAVAEHDEVEEVGQWFRVVRAVSAGADERMIGAASIGPNGDAGQVDAVEDVGVDELGR